MYINIMFFFLLGLTATSCSDDDEKKNNDFRGTWYCQNQEGLRYEFEGTAEGGTGRRYDGNKVTPISWSLTYNILHTINSKTYDTDQNGVAEIIGEKLYWCGKVYTRTPDGSGSGSGNGGGSATSDWAPSSMVGKIICWDEHNSDGTSGNSNTRVKFTNKTDMSTNFSDWCTYTYNKKSSKSAHLNFMAPQTVAGVVRTFQYDFDLNFTSATEFNVSGTLTVNYLSGPNVGSTIHNKFTGKGKFVDSLFGNDNNDSDDPDDPGKPSDVAKYKGRWLEINPGSEPGFSLKQMSYEFKEDGTFTYAYAMGVLSETGKYTCTSSSVKLYINSQYDRTLTLQNGKLVDKTNNKTFKKE